MKMRIMSKLLILCMLLSLLPTLRPTTATAADYPDYNVPDTNEWSLTTLDGGTIDQNTYKGKLRFFVFVLTTCPNSQGAVKAIANSEWITNEGVEVIVVFDDYSNLEEKKNFRKNYAPNNDKIVFAYGTKASSLLRNYMNNTLQPKGPLVYSVGVVVDKNNNIRRALSACGFYLANSFYNEAINEFLYELEPETAHTFDINGTFDYDEASEVLSQLNKLREGLGLNALTLDKELVDAAMQRAAEISIYYSHTRPNGQDPFTVFPQGYSDAAENIAAGQENASSAMMGWTGSPGHYKNMTLNTIDAVGIGCFYQEDGTKYWVQLFTGGRNSTEDNRKGKTTQKAEITALGSNLDINILPLSSEVTISFPQQFGLYNSNKGTSSTRFTRIIHSVYSSSETDFATIDANGLVTGSKKGSTWIRLGISNSIYWEKLVNVMDGYTISYDANGGTGAPDSQAKNHDKGIKLSSTVPVREGYTFLGWSTNATAKSAMYGPDGNVNRTMNNDMVLYAVWRAHSYTVTYDANGGSITPNSQVKTADTPLTLRTTIPKRTGYEFLGWATTKTATTATYQPGGIFTTMENTKLYAVWKVSTYSITYDANGGIGAPEPQEKTHAVALVLSSVTPTREGYLFQGWSTNKNQTNKTYQPGKHFTTNTDTTLYAVWKANTENVTAPTPTTAPSPTTAPIPTTAPTVTSIYEIKISPSENKTFTTETVGYVAQTPHSITVLNTGTKATGTLTVALTGTKAHNFTLSKRVIRSIAVGGSDSFTIVPKAGLKAGTYTATVTIKGTKVPSQKFTVSFTVTAAITKPDTPIITINSQPAASTTVTQGSITGNLTVNASETTGREISYQWAVSKTGKNPPLGTIIPGETSSSFAIPNNLSVGTYYYFCVINAPGAKSKRTNIAKVVVKASNTQDLTASKKEVSIQAYPTKTTYKVGEGFDTTGVNVVLTENGTNINVNDKITYFIKKINGVQLTQGRKFSTTGKKVVELRYEGKAVGTYTIYVNR